VPLDNPLGLVEAILASATPAELDGRVFGQEALRQDAAWQVALEEATQARIAASTSMGRMRV